MSGLPTRRATRIWSNAAADALTDRMMPAVSVISTGTGSIAVIRSCCQRSRC